MGYDAKAVVEKKTAHATKKMTPAKKRKPSAPPKYSAKCQKAERTEDPGSSFSFEFDIDAFVMAPCRTDLHQNVSFCN